MKKFFFFVSLLFFFKNLDAQFSNFEQFQKTVCRCDVEKKIRDYIQHDRELEQYYEITHDAFYLFASPENKKNKKPEFILYFCTNQQKPRSCSFVPRCGSTKPFDGLRVALDPGHLGGIMAHIEERFIDMVLPNKNNEHVKFDEGTLATLTAQVLKNYLTQAGAAVLMTRETPGQAVCPLSFDQWCKQNVGFINDNWLDQKNQQLALHYLMTSPMPPVYTAELKTRLSSINKNNSLEHKAQLIKQALFRLCYNQLDLNARAEKINAFEPHITIIIHYNANGGSSDISPFNYTLAFIPGSFLNKELSSQSARYEFVRFLVSNDIEESLRLSKIIMKNMETTLQIPLMNKKTYQENIAKHIDNGIYSRNLFLTRLIHSPLCYGETLIQNNQDEALRLVKTDAVFDGKAISSRIIQVAQAYFQGICEYFGFV
jgi:N-acetylmuramoyl-L-alanine amidase